MADIFLSYTEHDRDTVRRLADTLQAVGWSVWWDRRIPAGQTWRDVLERELQSMHCLVVLWSSRSVKSDWVCEEAAEARQRDRLVPVLIERVRPPAGFREVQAADLVDWDGARDFPGLQQLIGDIEQMIGKPGVAPREMPQPEPRMDGGDAAAADAQQVGASRHHQPRGEPRREPYGASRLPYPVSLGRKLLPWGAAAGVLLIAGGAYLVTARRAPPVVKAPPVATAPVALPSEAKPPATATASPVEQPVLNTPVKRLPDPLPRPSPSPGESREKTILNAPLAKANLPPRSAVKPGAAPASPASPRCAALTERLALGETLSSESQAFFNQECRK